MNINSSRHKYIYVLCILLVLLALGLTGKYIIREKLFETKYSSPLCKNCNVILVSLDTLSANHLPCYGYDRNTSPFLCAFAKQNIMFSHAYANGTYTLPSHVSMFTGLNSNIHRVYSVEHHSLSKNIPFLPEILQKNGYTTLFVLPPADINLPLDTVYNRGISKIYFEGPSSWNTALQDFAANVTQEKKTFLFLHTYAVHHPYLIGNKPTLYTTDENPNIPLTEEEYNSTSKALYQELYKVLQNELAKGVSHALTAVYKEMLSVIVKNNYDPQVLDPLFMRFNENYDKYVGTFVQNIKYNSTYDIHNQRDIDYLRALYDQRIHDLDQDEITKVLRFLSSNERIKNSTIVIFTADHGEEFMEHGNVYHVTVYDSNLHIPLIFYIPGNTKPEQISTPVQLTDLSPTILDMLGITYKNEFQGSSLVGEIRGKPLPDRLIVSDGGNLDTMVIRNKQWKLHAKRNPDSTFTPYALYDIQKDPNEKQNVLFSHLDIAKDFLSRYQNYELTWRAKKNFELRQP